MGTIPPLPFRKFAVVGDELRVGVLCQTQDEEGKALHHPDLLFEACGEDSALYDTAERGLYVTGWLQGAGPHLTASSYPFDGDPSEAARLQRSALGLIREWAAAESLDVSPKPGWLES